MEDLRETPLAGPVNGEARDVVPETSTKAGPSKSSSYFNKPTKPPFVAPSTNGGRRPSSSNALASYRLNGRMIPQSSQSGAAFDAFSFAKPASSLADKSSSSAPSRTEDQQRRHEEWRKRLAGPNGLVPRRRSLRLDEAAAAEARKAAGIELEEADGNDIPTPVEVDKEEGDEREKSVEGLGGKLRAKFAAKGSEAKGKGRAKKKEESLGPSGLTYTPLEKQFMEIKAENKDVLLLMEVGYKYL